MRYVNMNNRTTTEKNGQYYGTCTNFVSRESICINISSHASHMHVNDNLIYCNTDTDINAIPFPVPFSTHARTGGYNTEGRYTVDTV